MMASSIFPFSGSRAGQRVPGPGADRSLSGGRVTRELYAVSGSWLTWRVSRPLNAMNAERYAREAELRFALVRISDPRRTSRCTAASRTSGQLASLKPMRRIPQCPSRGG